MKASPLLRAWLRRLGELGVVFRLRHRWVGWDTVGNLSFDTPDGIVDDRSDVTVLALGEKEKSLANAVGAKSFSTNGPSRMPARISPTMRGCFSRSAR